MVGGLAAASALWIALPIHDYGYLPWFVAVPCPILWAPSSACSPRPKHVLYRCGKNLGPIALGLLAGGMWGTMEWLREFFLTGFPWISLASSLSAWPAWSRARPSAGGIGLGALLTRGVWLIRGRGLVTPARLAGVALLAGLAALGIWRMAQEPAQSPKVGVSVVQGNVVEPQVGRGLPEPAPWSATWR